MVMKLRLFIKQIRQRVADADPLKLSMQEGFSPRQRKVATLSARLVDIKRVSQDFVFAADAAGFGGLPPLLQAYILGTCLAHVDAHTFVFLRVAASDVGLGQRCAGRLRGSAQIVFLKQQ